MDKSNITKWRRRISLWGAMTVVLVYLIVWLIIYTSPQRFIFLSDGYNVILLILYYYVAPIMEIIGVVPLMKQPLPERFMNRWILAWGVRLLLLPVYFSQLLFYFIEIVDNDFFSYLMSGS